LFLSSKSKNFVFKMQVFVFGKADKREKEEKEQSIH
jgi:hypothetical protein